MLSAEFEPPKDSQRCACCGGLTTQLTRFVYRDGDAYAIYLAQFSNNHPDRVVLATVSLGEWGGDSTAQDRVAFALQLGVSDAAYQVSVLSAEESPWREKQILGRTLDRKEALSHPRIDEVFEVTDFMVAEDEPLKEYLNGGQHAA